MKVHLQCNQCIKDALEQDKENPKFPGVLEVASINDNFLYTVECPLGHVTNIILRQEKFEILFEIGAYAIRDGYYREAVTSFASSLERLYEYFIKCMFYQEEISDKDIETSWKTVAKQSERQLGAFIFLYLIKRKSIAPILSGDDVKFRNDVVHSGKIPSKAEAIKFGEAVLKIVREIKEIIKKDYWDGFIKSMIKHRELAAKHIRKSGKSFQETELILTTIIALSAGPEDADKISLVDAIDRLPK